MERLVFLLLLIIAYSPPVSALDVSHYYLDIQLDPATQSIEAMASLELEVLDEDFVDGKFPLHFKGMNVEMVGIDGLLVDYEHAGGLLVVGLPEGMGPGAHQLEVNYFGTPEPYVTGWGTWGLIIGEDRAFTVNVVEGARHWFPCNDVLTDKASFEVRVTAPENWEVAAPGELLNIDEGEGVRSFHWLANWALPTYLMHFAAGEYTLIEEEHDGLPYLYYLHPTSWEVAKETLDHAPTAIAMLEERYGDYPFPKVGFDEINLGGAVEHPSCVSIGTQLFAAPEDFADVIAHEMAHSWFQGIVTIADWKDLWLSEGLATYHEALYYGYLNGPESERDYVQSLALSYRTSAEMSEGFFPVHDPEEMWGVTVYRKGALVFHMLRYLVGDEAFLDLLNDYLAAFAGGNASTAAFLKVATGSSGVDLGPFFDEWVYGVGYPQFEVSWQWAAGELAVRVEQVQPEAWATFTSLPLELLASGADGESQRVSLSLTSRVTEVVFDLPFEPLVMAVDPDGWWLLKAGFVDYPETVAEVVELVEGPEPVADVSSLEEVEVLAADDSRQPADAVIEPAPKKSGGGCQSGRGGESAAASLFVLLLFLYGLQRLGHRRDRVS